MRWKSTSVARSANISNAKGKTAFAISNLKVLDHLSECHQGVLSTGGGSVLRPINRERLRARGHVFYLRSIPRRSVSPFAPRPKPPLAASQRPASTRLRDLFETRDPLYRDAAHYVIETGRPSVSTLVNMIVSQLELAGHISTRGRMAPSQSTDRPRVNLTPFTRIDLYVQHTSTLERVAIDLGDRSYPILIGEQLIDAADHMGRLAQSERPPSSSPTTPWAPLYAAAFASGVAPHYKQVHTVVLPDGETHKDWQTLNQIFDALLGQRRRSQNRPVRIGGWRGG